MRKILLLIFCLLISNVFAQGDVKISGKWFLHYTNGKSNGKDVSFTSISKGYVNFTKDIGDGFSVKVTPDIKLDNSGENKGDLNIRLKYFVLKYKMKNFGFISKPTLTVGLVPRSFYGFEQKINGYRIQGNMFMDRNKIIGTTDYGLNFSGLLGGEVSKDYQRKVNKAYPGRYGSFALGIYNGSGYHGIEENTNKIVDARLSLRPLSELLPNLQLTYYGSFGKGNTPVEPDFKLNAFLLTFDHEYFALTGQYFKSTGTVSGKAIENGKAYNLKGYSFFVDLKLVPKVFTVFARYDKITREKVTEENQNEIIAGAAYTVRKGIRLVLDYDTTKKYLSEYSNNVLVKFSMEVKF